MSRKRCGVEPNPHIVWEKTYPNGGIGRVADNYCVTTDAEIERILKRIAFIAMRHLEAVGFPDETDE